MHSALNSRRRNQTVLTAAALAGLGILPAFSRAADIHWDVADGNWDTATSWVGGVVPGNADRGILDRATGGTAHVTTDTADVTGVSVSAGNDLKVETGGNLTTLASTPDNNPADGIHIADGGAGTASVTDNGVLATTGGGYQATLTVGRGGGTGTLTVNGATALVDANDLHIGGTELPAGGGASAGNGTANLIAGKINARAWAFVGRDGGSGTLNVSGGTFNSSGHFTVGFNGGNGTVTQTGGEVGATSGGDGQVQIGQGGGSVGVYNLSGGRLGSANDFVVGNGGGATGTVNQTGGTMHNSGGWAFVGRSGGSGVYNLSAGDAIVNGQMNIGFEPGGVGTFNQTGGTAFFKELPHIGRGGGAGTYNLSAGNFNIGEVGAGSADDDLVVGADFGSTGTLNQTGGTLTASRWIFVGRAGNSGGGTGVINQSGGTLASNGWMRLGEAPGAVGTYNLSGTAVAKVGGGDGDTGDDDMVLGVDFAAQGIATVADSASLTVARDLVLGQNGATGTVTQTGGTVNVNAAAFIGHSPTGGGAPAAGTYTQSGGTLNTGIDLVMGLQANSSGTFTMSGGNANVSAVTRVGLDGAGVVNHSGGTLVTGSLTIAQNTATATGDYNLSGSGKVTALSTVNNGTFDASGAGIANLGPVDGTGAITVAGTAQIGAQHVRQASVTATGGTIKIGSTGTGTSDGVSIVPSYSLTGTGTFDLTDNKLFTNNAPGTATAGVYSGVQGDVQRALNGGAWDSPGLTTSMPDAVTGLTSIGVATGEQIRGLGPTDTDLFAGQTITGATTIAMYTYAGDANLDGFISGDDYSTIDFNAGTSADGWVNGDFNYDGIVSGDDYSTIDFNYAAQGAPFYTSGSGGLAGVTAVPEPATLGLVSLAALTLFGRRRRTK